MVAAAHPVTRAKAGFAVAERDLHLARCHFGGDMTKTPVSNKAASNAAASPITEATKIFHRLTAK